MISKARCRRIEKMVHITGFLDCKREVFFHLCLFLSGIGYWNSMFFNRRCTEKKSRELFFAVLCDFAVENFKHKGHREHREKDNSLKQSTITHNPTPLTPSQSPHNCLTSEYLLLRSYVSIVQPRLKRAAQPPLKKLHLLLFWDGRAAVRPCKPIVCIRFLVSTFAA